MKYNQTICQFLNIKVEVYKPFIIKHNDKEVYCEYHDGTWWLAVYNEKGYETYFEYSNGIWTKTEYDSRGNLTYREYNDGYWWKREYDSNGDVIYYENAIGYIEDNRPKELTMDEIADKFGNPVSQLKIKKD